jgi:hypothetical protein
VSESIRDEESLSAELSALRSALREVRAPDDEATLLSAARARFAARAKTREPSAVRPTVLAAARARVAQARRPVAFAAAAVIVGVAVLGVLLAQHAIQDARVAASSRAGNAVAATSPQTADPEPRPAFRPISFSRGLSSVESYSVVRVRLELATAAPGAAPSAAIEADLLVGEDGLARAIRFDSADTLPVYAAARPASGERR